jgi:hypothetical protein
MSKGQRKPTKAWKDLPGTQVTEDSLWEMTKNYTCYLTKNHDLTLSTDPLNITNRNTKRDSGICAVHALGISFEAKERNIKVKKVKKKASVIRIHFRVKTKRQLPKTRLVDVKGKPKTNYCIYSERKDITVNAVVKALRRDLRCYRRDLVSDALKKLNLLRTYKLRNKWEHRRELKKLKN